MNGDWERHARYIAMLNRFTQQVTSAADMHFVICVHLRESAVELPFLG